jgi:hypothetical protein
MQREELLVAVLTFDCTVVWEAMYIMLIMPLRPPHLHR